MLGDYLKEVQIGDEAVAETQQTGVEVRVTELHHDWRSLEAGGARQEFTEIFALYLADYPEVSIFLESGSLDPSTVIADRQGSSFLQL